MKNLTASFSDWSVLISWSLATSNCSWCRIISRCNNKSSLSCFISCCEQSLFVSLPAILVWLLSLVEWQLTLFSLISDSLFWLFLALFRLSWIANVRSASLNPPFSRRCAGVFDTLRFGRILASHWTLEFIVFASDFILTVVTCETYTSEIMFEIVTTKIKSINVQKKQDIRKKTIKLVEGSYTGVE